ncbi:hypothetical protein, partial [Halalkalibacter oceani]|uniref:hypothetical protein n=1 Tax=Halalkalibacter oceani TaxID=1653776 RepID=UPI003399B23E
MKYNVPGNHFIVITDDHDAMNAVPEGKNLESVDLHNRFNGTIEDLSHLYEQFLKKELQSSAVFYAAA